MVRAGRIKANKRKKTMTKNEDALQVLRDVRERLTTQRREIAVRLTRDSTEDVANGFNATGSFVEAQAAIEAVDRAIKDEESSQPSVFERVA